MLFAIFEEESKLKFGKHVSQDAFCCFFLCMEGCYGKSGSHHAVWHCSRIPDSGLWDLSLAPLRLQIGPLSPLNFILLVLHLCLHYDGRVFLMFDRPSVGPRPSGSTSFYYVDDRLCYLGGGSLDGGDVGSPRCLGPPRLTPEGCGAAHGPRHPANPLLL